MKHAVVGGSAFPLIEMQLEKGESVKAVAGAMLAMSSAMKLVGKMDGGFGKAFARMFTGETFFLQNIMADSGNGWVLLASSVPGGVASMELDGSHEFVVQKGGFLAGTSGIDISSKVQSLSRGLFSGEGFFVVKISGKGTAFLSTYGSIYTIDVPKGDTVLIDNGHLVAWDARMKYEITKGAAGWISAMTSGEGLACRFHGPGKVLVQTRNPQALAAWIFPMLPIPRVQGQG